MRRAPSLEQTCGIALFLVCLAVRLYVLFGADFVYDDAFITWRVARNLGEGLGAVFNSGERVQATSSLLHTGLCALLWRLFGESGILADRLLACLLDSLLVLRIALDLLQPRGDGGSRAGRLAGALMFGAAYVSAKHIMAVIPGGLETSLFLTTSALALRAANRGSWKQAAGLASAAALARPDGQLVVALVALLAWHGRGLPSVLRVWACVLAPCLLLQWLYYGTLIPQTVTAKSQLLYHPGAAWAELMREFFVGGRRQMVCAALALLGGYASWHGRTGWPVLVWATLHAAAISTFTFWWPWYWAPVALAFALAMGIGTALVVDTLGRYVPVRLVGGACAVAALLLGATQVHQGRAARAALHVLGLGYELQDRAMAAFLNAESPPDASILVERVGRVAFHTRRRFDDYPGLASPAVTDALRGVGRPVLYPPADTGAFAAVLSRVKPDYLLLRKNEYAAGNAAAILTDYALLRTFEPEPRAARVAEPEYTRMFVLRRRR